MLRGVLIAESLRTGSLIELSPLIVHKIERVAPDNTTEDQPCVWTLIHFESHFANTETLSTALANVLDEPGWYADFHSDTESVVVFPGRVFQYPRGDEEGRARAKAHGRSLGIPESQLDWPR